MSNRIETDVLVIGSGAAGIALTLVLKPEIDVVVLSKEGERAGSSNRAQGGIAAVLGSEDSFESHIEDTLNAGAGICDPAAVEFVVRQAPNEINALIELGMQFDTEDNDFHLTQEGGHSHRRVLHVADHTGRSLVETLARETRTRENISVLSNRVAIDVVVDQSDGRRVAGAYVYNVDLGTVEVIQASTVVLATGGASKVYLYTSNPDGSTGDGIAIAARAGAHVTNMEFNQFHPTCLYHPNARSFLISEAVRGEGGRLILPDGSSFMAKYDRREELAPRDIVARAIDQEMKRHGLDCVFLDVSHKPDSLIENHFPTIHQTLLTVGIDMRAEPIPIVPAAHYTCGGVVVDLDGKTNIDGLYALGETACTGLHGANRLASNSLTECLVFARAAGKSINQRMSMVRSTLPEISNWDESQVVDSDEDIVLKHNWLELRRFMWDYVGIVRTNKRLNRARHRIDLLKQEIQEFYSNYRVNGDLIELRNLVHVAEQMVNAALARTESRGLHYSTDYPRVNELRTGTVN